MILTTGATVGKYRLDSPLAEGGTGSVWSARHIQLEKPVAVKFLSPALVGSAISRARFKREAHTAAAIQSCHVVRVLDFGVEDDTPYLVMELLHGEDLAARLARVKRLPLEQAALILIDVAKALCHAHEAGIVHRDLKPSNLFLAVVDDEETVKILDFGIAKQHDTPVVERPSPETMLGSPSYASPEQAAGDDSVDHRSDLWSMAVVLYEMLTGVPPFQGLTTGCVLRKVFMEPPSRMADVAPDLPPELDAFFDKALAKARSARFGSIEEMTHAFVAIAAPNLKALRPSLPVPCHPTARAGDSTPPCSAPSLAPTVRERDVLHVVSAVPGAVPLDEPDPRAAKRSLGKFSRRHRARPWLFAAATPAAAALLLPLPAGPGPDVGPAVVQTAELPPSLAPTFVPPSLAPTLVPSQPAAPISPRNAPAAAASLATKPTSAHNGAGGAPPRTTASTPTAALAPASVNNTSPATTAPGTTAPTPAAPPPGSAVCNEKPPQARPTPPGMPEKRWF
jgi:serine/threonine protein kinase